MRYKLVEEITSKIKEAPIKFVFDKEEKRLKEAPDYNSVEVGVRLPHNKRDFYYLISCHFTAVKVKSRYKVRWVISWSEVQQEKLLGGFVPVVQDLGCFIVDREK